MTRNISFAIILCITVTLTAGCAVSYHTGRERRVTSDGNLTIETVNRDHDSTLKVTLKGTGAGEVQLKDTRIKQVLPARLQAKQRFLVLTTSGKERVRMYEVGPSGLKETWRGIRGDLRPWKVQVGDVDGDGVEEIGVGVYKKARFHPVMANRPFIYGWDGKDVYAKWLGSRLSRPFTDFVLADFGPGPAKLVAIEEAKDSGYELAVYTWNGFGFLGDWRGEHSKVLSDLSVRGTQGKQTVTVESGRATREYIWDGRRLRAKEEK